MNKTSDFSRANHYRPRERFDFRGVSLPSYFAEPAEEYRAARERCGLFDRSDRGLLELTGADAKSWLHNLVTNTVQTLDENLGNYAFALDVKGRIQFDLNILSLPDRLWLDLDRQALPSAKCHLERYCIMEDVTLVDASAAYARIGCSGPAAVEIARVLRVPQFPSLGALSSVTLELEGEAGRFVRHDFTGMPAFELYVPRTVAPIVWDHLAGALGAFPAGQKTLDVLRIEAGIPWLGFDIDDRVLPPETGQIERAISYQKGCYLGQEVIERMRSRGSLAWRLVRLMVTEGAELAPGAVLYSQGAEVGRITSLAAHPLGGRSVGLGYLSTKIEAPTQLSAGPSAQRVRVLGDATGCAPDSPT